MTTIEKKREFEEQDLRPGSMMIRTVLKNMGTF